MGAELEDAWKDTTGLHRPEEPVSGQQGSGHALPVPGPSFTPSAIRAGLSSGSPKRPGLVAFLILNLVYFLFIFKN